jgi:hypothetical protein
MNKVTAEVLRFPAEKWKQTALYPLMPLLCPSLVIASKMSHWRMA